MPIIALRLCRVFFFTNCSSSRVFNIEVKTMYLSDNLKRILRSRRRMEDFFSNSAHYEFHRVTYDYVTRKSNHIYTDGA